MKVPFKRKAVLRLIVCLLAFVAAMEAWIFLVPQKREVDFMYSQEAFGNPLMGYAPSAWHETVGEDVTLLYMDITWKELEPQEGVFDWESIEEENQLDRWRNQGKRIVLRFVCDLPGEEEHRDIPDWLYEKIGGAGTAYHTSYGYGFSPDYTNPEFLACHLRAVQALGERYGQDGFVAYVELGSLGHWGEWHVRYQDGIQRLPNREIREQYVSHWAYAFPHAKLLTRRPFREGEAYGVGLYNDMAGHRESTEEWLTWIREGERSSAKLRKRTVWSPWWRVGNPPLWEASLPAAWRWKRCWGRTWRRRSHWSASPTPPSSGPK